MCQFGGEGYLGYAGGGWHYRLAIVQSADSGLLERLRGLLVSARSGARGAAPPGRQAFHLEAQREIFEFCVGVLPHVMVEWPRVLEALASLATAQR